MRLGACLRGSLPYFVGGGGARGGGAHTHADDDALLDELNMMEQDDLEDKLLNPPAVRTSAHAHTTRFLRLIYPPTMARLPN